MKPLRWCGRGRGGHCALALVAASAMSACVARAHEVTYNIPYASAGSPNAALNAMDLYTPAGGVAASAPTVVVVHGGGYSGGDKWETRGMCGMLADRGFNVLTINYTLATRDTASYPQAIRDVKAVVRWVRTDGAALGLSPTVVLWGGSAGATIAQTAAYADGHAHFELMTPPPGGYRVDAVIGFYGRYDLVWDAASHGSPPPLVTYLGGAYTAPEFAGVYSGAGAITYVDACSPPTKLVHGSADPIVPAQHTVRLAAALDAAGVFNIVNIVAGAGHGTGILGSDAYTVEQTASAIPLLLSAPPGNCVRSGSPQRPPNDECADAQPVSGGTIVSGDSTGATGTIVSGCGGGADTRDVWFAFIAPQSRRYTFDTATGAGFDTTLVVQEGCGAGARVVACDDNSGGLGAASVSVAMEAGQGVLVRLAGVNGASGVYTLRTDESVAPPQGACCAANGSCAMTPSADCTGVWRDGAVCDAATCEPYAPEPGACCSGTACTMVAAAAACTGEFAGAGTVCGEALNPMACCRANVNQTGGLSVQDVFDFLGAYFGQLPMGDFNRSSTLTVQDVFDFLSAFFAGC